MTKNTEGRSVSTVVARLGEMISPGPISIPDGVLARARLAILDTIGTTIGAKQSPDFNVLDALVRDTPVGSTSRLIGRFGVASPAETALVNSYTAHLLDFDDSHGGMAGHPTAVIFPAALALADGGRNSVRSASGS